MLEIEIKLKQLDETLEVFIDESLDKNKLRLKNSPQTKATKLKVKCFIELLKN